MTPAIKANYLAVIAKWMNTFHIHAFVMASGFLFYYLKTEKSKYNETSESIKKRAKRLIIPYIFTTIFWVGPITYYFYKTSFSKLIHKFILCESPSQLWFLIMLFILSCLFIVFYKKIKISTRGLVILYIASTILSSLLGHFDINYFQINMVCKFSLFFYLGGYLYKYKQYINVSKIIFLVIITIIMFCGIFITKNTLIIKGIIAFGLQMLSLLEVILIYFIGNYFINVKRYKFDNKIYKIFEENSFGIYLFHQQIIYFCIVIFNGLIHPIIQVILSFVIALNVSLVMTLILRKNKITKFMFGL